MSNVFLETSVMSTVLSHTSCKYTYTVYNLYLNDCTLLEIWIGSIVAAQLVISRKINIFTSVQRVIALFYKRSCFVCFLFPTGSCGDENNITITPNCEPSTKKSKTSKIKTTGLSKLLVADLWGNCSSTLPGKHVIQCLCHTRWKSDAVLKSCTLKTCLNIHLRLRNTLVL